MKAIKYWGLLFILGIFTGCESLEDTYSDYTEGGAQRYLGKCQDLSVEPGWKRLIVNWKNHVDPVIDKIKVSWTLDGVEQDTLLEKGTTSCNITGLENGTYEIAVRSVDKEGNMSLPVLGYVRPYTSEHENVMSFTRLVSKHFFVKNRLALVFDEWSDNIETATLCYYSGEKRDSLIIDSEFIEKNPYLLLDKPIDPNSPVTIERSGYLKGCTDLIVFEPYELTRHRMYTPDFKELMRVKYGVTEVTEDFVSTLETLEVDYDIFTLEDILNMPALKTLYLGKNRYLHSKQASDFSNYSTLNDEELSAFAMEVAAEVNGLKVERYNKHYFWWDEFDFMEEKGNPQLPELSYLKADKWKYSYAGESKDEEELIPRLFDEASQNGWQSRKVNESSKHEIIVDMQEMKLINGVVISQQLANNSNMYYIAQKIQIKTSIDGETWTDATHVVENKLGATKGETTILNFSSPKNAQYVKFILTDQQNSNGSSFAVSLQKIKFF